MAVQILVGDCRELLAGLSAGRFHTCVTSPPYWGLRDYGTEPLEWPAMSYAPLAGLPPCVEIPAMQCSLGLEPTLEAFIGHMVLVFREVRRVLRDDGTAWVNMGDSYAGSRGTEAWGPSEKATKGRTASRRRDDEPIPRNDVRVEGLKPKDLVGQPWRLALALQADGWWLRSDVIWHKKNPMPESTKDRPTKAHEYVFLLSKSERYYYDAEAIKEPASEDTHARYARNRSSGHKHAGEQHAMPGQRQQTIARGFEHMRKPVGGWQTGPGSHTAIEHQQADESRHGKLIEEPTGEAMRRISVPGNKTHRGTAAYEGGDEFHRTKGGLVKYAEKMRKLAKADSGTKNNESFDAAMAVMPEARNKRSVWTLSTEGYKDAHFATFPTKLIEPCILAGCPEGGEVLDCFGGSGTTGLVADRLGRNAVLCELNPEYAAMGDRRVAGDRGHVARQIGMELPGD